MDDDKFIPGLAANTAQGAFQAISHPDDKGGAVKVFLAFSALLLFAGTEPLKLLLRENIGKRALGLKSVIISCLAYFIWAYYLYYQLNKEQDEQLNRNIYLAAIAFYCLLGLAILIFGVLEYLKKSYSLYRGDSKIFGGLVEYGISQKVIWAVIEPVSCIALGALMTLIHPFLGYPFLVTSISFFLNELYQIFLVPRNEAEREQQMASIQETMQQKTSGANEHYNKI